METLKGLTPKQIEKLTPEHLQMILQHDTKSRDIATLKYYFTTSHYRLNNSDKIFNQKQLDLIRDILIKYQDENFYIEYSIHKTTNCAPNYEYRLCNIYTKDEIMERIPAGIDITKICYSKNNKPLPDIVNYPKTSHTEINKTIDLINFHENLYAIHPSLLKVGIHFNTL